MEIFLLLIIIALIAPKNLISFLFSAIILGAIVYSIIWLAALSAVVAVLASN